MKMKLKTINEPPVRVGDGKSFLDPKAGIQSSGPLYWSTGDSITPITLGLVTTAEAKESICGWFAKMRGFLIDTANNTLRYPPFPGVEKTFRTQFVLENKFIKVIDEKKYARCLAVNRQERFRNLLDLFGATIESLFVDSGPQCILVHLPEEIATLCIANDRLSYAEQRELERIQKDEEDMQLELFDLGKSDQKESSELIAQAEELLSRVFYRALKARCMMAQNAVPIQIIRKHTFIQDESRQNDATRAWNLSLALCYKARRIAWMPSDLHPGTCFIGISFHHQKSRGGHIYYASLAQAFSNDMEPFALRGDSVPHDQVADKSPYLTEKQSSQLISRVISEFEVRTGGLPSRIVVHKTSRYQQGEACGFRTVIEGKVADCDLVWIRPTPFRLIKKGLIEPRRGTLCIMDGERYFLFTTGFVDWWKEYPGPHIPAPLEIGAANDTDLVERAREILCLTKMNWNNCDGISKYPITIGFARNVGMIMTELDEDAQPQPSYRFYM